MVVLTVVALSNNHTVYFDRPIPKPNYIRLLSCSLYNSWHNLKSSAEISVGNKNAQGNTIIRLAPGYYTPESMANTITQEVQLSIKTNTPQGSVVIFNPNNEKLIGLSGNLHSFFDVDRQIHPHIAVKKFNSPRTYFIHCDLVDKEQNLLNGKPSSVLARFNIRGKPYEKVYYQTAQQHVLRDTSTGEYANG